MPGRSIKLKFKSTEFAGGSNGPVELECDREVYISPSMARRLQKKNAVVVDSQRPFILRLRTTVEPTACIVQRWSRKSDGRTMNGAALEKKPPRL
jgi:hypothetical protein